MLLNVLRYHLVNFIKLGLMHKGEKRYFKDVAEFIKRSFDEKF